MDHAKIDFLADCAAELAKRADAMICDARKDAEQTKINKAEAVKKIQGLTKAQLNAAFNSSRTDPGIKKLVEKELDDRANRGL